MSPADIHQIVSNAIWTILYAAGPVLIAALVVGLGIALFQALTSVQDMTLTFVPKVAAILIAIILTLPYMYGMLMKLSNEIFGLIISNGF